MRSPEGLKKRQRNVGAFMVLGFLVFFTFSMKMTDSPIFRSGSKVTVYLNDATGIFLNSKVKLSGIDVGVVDKIQLDDQRAKITLVIDKGVKLPDPAIVVPKPLGVLGDKFLEIQRVNEDDLKKQSEEVTPQTSVIERAFDVLSDMAVISAQATPTGGGPSRVYKTGETLPARHQSAALDDLMRDVSKLSDDMKVITREVRGILSGNRTKIDSTIANFDKISTDLAQLSKVINDKEVKKEIEKLTESVLQLGNTVRNLESISAKIQNGEGTLGKLVNDPETIDRVNDTLGAVNSTLDRARRIQALVDVETLYLGQSAEVQTRVQLGLHTSYDFAYWAGISIDDYGTYEKSVTTKSVGGGIPEVTTEEIRKPNGVKFSFLLYKKFQGFSAAAGMIDNNGGFQFELFNRRESLRASAMVYDFGSETNPIVRLNLVYNPWSVFTVSAGYFHLFENARVSDSRKSWTIGLGLRFTDDDLKTVLLIPGVG